MMKMYVLVVALVMAVLVVSPTRAEGTKSMAGTAVSAASSALPSVSVVELTTVKVTVVSVNLKNRKVKLKAADGSVFVVKADKRIKNLDKLKAGDTIEIDYLESIAAVVVAPGAPIANAAQMVAVSPPGKEMDAVTVASEQVSVKVVEIDAAGRRLKLQSPDGKTLWRKVSPAVQNFDNIKIGDRVVVTVTDAVGLEIRQPK